MECPWGKVTVLCIHLSKLTIQVWKLVGMQGVPQLFVITPTCTYKHTEKKDSPVYFFLNTLWCQVTEKNYVLTKYTSYIYAFQLDTYKWLAETSLRHLCHTSPSSRSNSNRHFLANCGFREWAWNHLFHGICQESNISDACCAPCQNKPSQNHIMTCVSPCFRLSDPGYPFSPFRVCH